MRMAGCGTIVILLSVSLLILATGQRSAVLLAQSKSTPIAGDCDRSGAVNAVDVQLVINSALGIPVLHPTDIDHSDAVNAADVQLVINAALRIVIDADGDGLCEGAEANLGTNPALFDTDSDGVGDGQEVLDGTDPLSGAILTVKLAADPSQGPGPLECVLNAQVGGAGIVSLTYTFDFGDGTSESSGNPGALHVYADNGAYTAKVTVSDGVRVAVDTLSLTVAPTTSISVDIGAAGGPVELGQCQVTVPPGLVADPIPFTLTELPSLAEGCAAFLDPAQFVPIGSAYRLNAPVKPSQPLTVTLGYGTLEIPEGFSSANLGVLVRSVGLPVIKDAGDSTPGRPLSAVYMALPANGVAKSPAVQFDRYEGGTFQLVAMANPLLTDTNSKSKAGSMPLVTVVYNDTPPNQVEYGAAVWESIAKTYQVLVDGRGFTGPAGSLTIVVGKMPNNSWDGYVWSGDHHTLYIRSSLTPMGKVKKVIPHEFFHLVQNLSNNQTSTFVNHPLDAWFKEGTAEWACDEVYDDFPGYYGAPWWTRYCRPLNEEGYDGSTEYQTVGFWKWVEAQRPGTILSTILSQQLRTHTLLASGAWLENTNQYTFQDTFQSVWPDAKYVDFAAAVKYWKDFDPDETNPGDLWSSDSLSEPLTVQYAATDLVTLKAGQGDSRDTAVPVVYPLEQYLSLDVKLIKSDGLSGMLHIQFLKSPEPFDARVIVEPGGGDSQREFSLTDLSTEDQEITTSFKADGRAVVIPVDARWQMDTGDTFNEGQFKVWIEDPCATTSGVTVEVSTVAELVTASETIGSGNTIRIAPGTYVLPAERPTPWGYKTSLWVDGLTLVGAGLDLTILQPQWISVLGDTVRFRDMTIRSDSQEPFDVNSVRDFAMCNVAIVGTVPLFYGLTVRTPYNAAKNKNYVMSISDCSFYTKAYPLQVGTTGIKIWGCDCDDPNCRIAGEPVQYDPVDLYIENTQIQGFKYGVQGHFRPVQIDCSDISAPWGRAVSNLAGYRGENCN